jgi:hypothetical protein
LFVISKERNMISNRQVWETGFMASAIYLICAVIAFFKYPLA